MVVKYLGAAAVVLATAACGGGGSTPPLTIPLLSPAPAGSYNALVNTETQLLNQFSDQTGRITRTTAQNMPGTELGSVVYTGTAAFTVAPRPTITESRNGSTIVTRPNPDIAGNLTMNVSFANRDMNGTISQFRDAGNTPLPGTLTLEDAPIVVRDFGTGAVSGTFPVNGTAQNVTSLGYSGNFIGQNANGITGTVGFLAPRFDGGAGQQSYTLDILAARP